MKPVCIDLFCGLFGWGTAFAEAGYRVIGFDIENQLENFNKEMPDGCELILRDIRSINGADLVKEFGVPACIVASPPCQFFSYCAMPWSKAKKLMADVLASPERIAQATDLFNQCFRIQREVSAAAGHYVPMVVENVRGAQRWVGKARWNFGSFYLWGDVPALMPIPGKVRKTPEGSWDTSRKNYNADHAWECNISEGVKAGDRNKGAKNGEHKWSTDWSNQEPKGEGNKTAGMNWSDRSKKGQDFTRIAGQQAEATKVPSENGRRTAIGNGARFTSRDCGVDGVKFSQTGAAWFPVKPRDKMLGGNGPAAYGSKSSARKQASAEIAKIPPALASWIAKVFKPQ